MWKLMPHKAIRKDMMNWVSWRQRSRCFQRVERKQMVPEQRLAVGGGSKPGQEKKPLDRGSARVVFGGLRNAKKASLARVER
jgi:hypothetical protein